MGCVSAKGERNKREEGDMGQGGGNFEDEDLEYEFQKLENVE
jgi:hypothetical protein